jgi:hypothetical protein
MSVLANLDESNYVAAFVAGETVADPALWYADDVH